MKYRQVLYGNYHSTQSGRASGTQAQVLFDQEYQQFKREVGPFFTHLSKQTTLFDMGCGKGSLIKMLRDQGFEHAIGMDISAEQIAVGRACGATGIVEGDALAHLLSGNNTYDVITGMDIIEHFTKDELVELMLAIHSRLNPGGMAIFRTPNMDAPFSTVFANGDFTHENYMNASSAQQLLLSCGFNEVKVLPSVMRVKGFFKEFIRKYLHFSLSIHYRLILFASARSSRNILFTPNMIIVAKRG